ncbi:hypothetical protein RFI_13147 [Reticulomyxa filosa]|uniref:UBA domain-containing protein n=1 Tax=Reticulomyxa filosa TaxID=46433 RepID=X6NF96_RETFI|nr:hypothetical protein RFI_13147 [Reticulomyxa filosa]|eukprot:ETO24012.1 hypothetical protein RFI_13147 [Reticulomyxa filosa]
MREALSKNNDNVKKAAEYIIKQQQPSTTKRSSQMKPSSQSQPQSQSQHSQQSQSQPQSQQQQRTSIKGTLATSSGSQSSQMQTMGSSGSSSNNSNNKISVNSKEDAERMKQKLLQEAEMKQKEIEKEKQRQQMELRKHEDDYLREEKRKEVQKIEMQKKVAENRALITAKKKQAEDERRLKLLEWHKRHEKYDAASKAEQSLKTPEQAVQCLFERYGEDVTKINSCVFNQFFFFFSTTWKKKNICKEKSKWINPFIYKHQQQLIN